VQYVADRRLVVDRGVATTTGVTASMPIALTLIGAIAGRDQAEACGPVCADAPPWASDAVPEQVVEYLRL